MTSALDDRARRIAALGYDYTRQPTRLVSRCNLCRDDRFVHVAHHDRYGYPVEAHGCRRCGLVFLNPVMELEAYREFYATTYRPLVSAYHGRLIDVQTIKAEQHGYASDCAALLEPFLKDGQHRTVLDIGGSTGVVASDLSVRFGLTAAVLDPSPLEITEAKRLGLETIMGFVEEFDPAGRRFDVVLLCQTIDHLLDVTNSLEAIRRLITPTGLLFVDIVDFRAAYLRHWSVEQAVKIDHPYYLTEITASAHLRRAGFEVLHSSYAADHLHVAYVCRPSQPEASFLPSVDGVDVQWREIRFVQNAPKPS